MFPHSVWDTLRVGINCSNIGVFDPIVDVGPVVLIPTAAKSHEHV